MLYLKLSREFISKMAGTTPRLTRKSTKRKYRYEDDDRDVIPQTQYAKVNLFFEIYHIFTTIFNKTNQIVLTKHFEIHS